MDILRKSCKVSRRDQINNHHVENTQRHLKKTTYAIGYIKRMPENRLPELAMNWVPQIRKEEED